MDSTCVGNVDGLTEGILDTREHAYDTHDTIDDGIDSSIAEQ